MHQDRSIKHCPLTMLRPTIPPIMAPILTEGTSPDRKAFHQFLDRQRSWSPVGPTERIPLDSRFCHTVCSGIPPCWFGSATGGIVVRVSCSLRSVQVRSGKGQGAYEAKDAGCLVSSEWEEPPPSLSLFRRRDEPHATLHNLRRVEWQPSVIPQVGQKGLQLSSVSLSVPSR